MPSDPQSKKRPGVTRVVKIVVGAVSAVFLRYVGRHLHGGETTVFAILCGVVSVTIVVCLRRKAGLRVPFFR